MDKEKILLRIKHLLEDTYGKEPWIAVDQGQVILEGASKPNAPIIPEEVGEIVKKAMEEFQVPSTHLAYSISNGTILVGFSSN